MANITSIEINQFRGIKQLTVSDFSNVNLIVGDNNSGKTLLMELLYGVVDLIKKWKAECTNVKRTEREDIKYIRFDQEWYKDVENKINIWFSIDNNLFNILLIELSIEDNISNKLEGSLSIRNNNFDRIA